jgi:hypothetical protein
MARIKKAPKSTEEAATITDRRGRKRKAENAKPSERGLGPGGGGWSVKQASAWCGIGENFLRSMAKNHEIPCVYFVGRRIVLAREGFMNWFNSRSSAA